MSAKVLITDVQERAMVATCRGLALGGYQVSAASTARPAAGHWSRYPSKRLRLPDPVRDSFSFVDALEGIVRDNGHSILIPGGDASLLAISANRERLEPHVKTGLPPHGVVQRSVDKLALLEAAAGAGLPCPETIPCSDLEQARAVARDFGYPVVFKPRTTVFPRGQSMEQISSAAIPDEQTLEDRFTSFGDPCLVQRLVQGPIFSCSGVIAGGELLGFATSRYRRTYPPDGGPVSFSETVDPPEGLRSKVESLLRGLGWQGLFEVEFVYGGGQLFSTIDLNPRVFGSLWLVISAGAPLPVIWCDWLLGRSSPMVTARAGMRYRWEDADARHLIWQLRHGRFRAAAAVIRPRRRVVHAYFRLRDPGPLFARLLYMALQGITRRRRSRSKKGF
jgi:predicted ATP-grasp superfamily ATP-dependent carboligase